MIDEAVPCTCPPSETPRDRDDPDQHEAECPVVHVAMGLAFYLPPKPDSFI